jgi:hypothetical protein
MLFAIVCIEEIRFEAKRVLAEASARCHLQVTAASSSVLAQATTTAKPSQATVGIIDESGRKVMGLVNFL